MRGLIHWGTWVSQERILQCGNHHRGNQLWKLQVPRLACLSSLGSAIEWAWWERRQSMHTSWVLHFSLSWSIQYPLSSLWGKLQRWPFQNYLCCASWLFWCRRAWCNFPTWTRHRCRRWTWFLSIWGCATQSSTRAFCLIPFRNTLCEANQYQPFFLYPRGKLLALWMPDSQLL